MVLSLKLKFNCTLWVYVLATLMGNAKSSDKRTRPENIKEINSSLYELYGPSFGTAELDIVFFHGLQPGDYKDAYWTTWSSNGAGVWPITLLSKEYPKSRIMSVSYDSCATMSKTKGHTDLYQIREKLLADLVFDKDAAVGVNRPLILVGHSLGGLVIKDLILHADKKKNQLQCNETEGRHRKSLVSFIKNLRGIVYYATPHGGSELANYAAKLPKTSDIMKVLTVFNKDTAGLNEDFRIWRKNYSKPAFTFFESLPTVYGKVFHAVVVNAVSARMDSDEFYPVNADHSNICKPNKDTDSHYKLFSQFIQNQLTIPSSDTNAGETVSGNTNMGPNFAYGFPVNVVGKWTVSGNADNARLVENVGTSSGGNPDAPAGYQWDLGRILRVVKPPTACGTLTANQGLYPGQTITSCDGRFSLTLQSEGNLVLKFGTSTLFSIGTSGQKGAYALMQDDGNFVLYNSTREAIWSTGTPGNAGATFDVQDDGNLVVYSSSRKVLWQIDRKVTPPTACGTLTANQGLYPGQTMNSCDGRFALTLESDGNLVLKFGYSTLFSTGTSGQKTAQALMQGDGNFVLYDSTGKPIWATGTHGNVGATFNVQDDGNLVVYSSSREALWNSGTGFH